MPRPKKAIESVKKTLHLPMDLVARVDLELMSEVEGRIPHAAWQSYICTLIRQDLERVDKLRKASITQPEPKEII